MTMGFRASGTGSLRPGAAALHSPARPAGRRTSYSQRCHLSRPASKDLRRPRRRAYAVVPVKALADFTSTAVDLFNNMRIPAALIGGSIVPMSFASGPEPNPSDDRTTSRLKQAHMAVSVLSLSAQISAVIQSTVAINKIHEVPFPLASSVTEFLFQNLELQWLGTNVTFLLGTLGFGLLIGIRTWIVFGSHLGKAGMCMSGAVVAHSLSVINQGISLGDGEGFHVGSNFAGLIIRFASLVAADLAATNGVMQGTVILMTTAALAFFLRSLTSQDSRTDQQGPPQTEDATDKGPQAEEQGAPRTTTDCS